MAYRSWNKDKLNSQIDLLTKANPSLDEIMDLENFFDDVISSEKLGVDIGGTGEFKVSYRGIVDGKGKNFPQNLDHKIILLQEPKCLDIRENIQITGFSKFKPRGRISD